MTIHNIPVGCPMARRLPFLHAPVSDPVMVLLPPSRLIESLERILFNHGSCEEIERC